LFQERALDIMRHHLPEQRRESRLHNPLSGTVSPIHQPSDPQVAALRDMNTLGAFFYSNLEADLGDDLSLEMVLPDSGDGRQLKICCEGVVVRIEPGFDGIASGFAVRFSRYDISWVQ
jgi:PilZ domain